MIIRDLLTALNNLPPEALDKQIYVNNEGLQFNEIMIEPITESFGDSTIIGYMISEKEERQLELDFTKEANSV